MAKDSSDPSRQIATELETRLEQQKNELSELKSADKGRLKEERDQLQEQFVTSEQKLQESQDKLKQLELDHEVLIKDRDQDWLLYGGALVIIGIFLGFILPKVSWRRKSGWDSF